MLSQINRRNSCHKSAEETFSNAGKTNYIAHTFKHCRTSAIDRLHFEVEDDRVQNTDAEKLLIAISPFGRYIEAHENMPDDDAGQDKGMKIRMVRRVILKKMAYCKPRNYMKILFLWLLLPTEKLEILTKMRF